MCFWSLGYWPDKALKPRSAGPSGSGGTGQPLGRLCHADRSQRPQQPGILVAGRYPPRVSAPIASCGAPPVVGGSRCRGLGQRAALALSSSSLDLVAPRVTNHARTLAANRPRRPPLNGSSAIAVPGPARKAASIRSSTSGSRAWPAACQCQVEVVAPQQLLAQVFGPPGSLCRRSSRSTPRRCAPGLARVVTQSVRSRRLSPHQPARDRLTNLHPGLPVKRHSRGTSGKSQRVMPSRAG